MIYCAIGQPALTRARITHFKPNLEQYKNIVADRKYNVDRWNPVGADVDKLAEYISKKKKLDPFYKNHASSLSNPTFILLKIQPINTSNSS